MSDNITDSDRAAAHKYLQDCNDSGQLAVVMATKADRLYQAFAAYRQAAVAKREKEIVGMMDEVLREARDTMVYGAGFLVHELGNLIKKIQTPSEGAGEVATFRRRPEQDKTKIEELQAEIRDLQGAYNLHVNLNRRAAEALGKPNYGDNSSWHDIPEQIEDLRQRLQAQEKTTRYWAGRYEDEVAKNTKQAPAYRIRATDETDEPLYWHNELGWVDEASADLYDEAEKAMCRLPIGGCWEVVARNSDVSGS